MNKIKGNGGRLSRKAMLARWFVSQWTLEEAEVYLAGSRALLPENQKLLALIEQSDKIASN